MSVAFRLDFHDFDPDRFNNIKKRKELQKSTLNKCYVINWVAIRETNTSQVISKMNPSLATL